MTLYDIAEQKVCLVNYSGYISNTIIFSLVFVLCIEC